MGILDIILITLSLSVDNFAVSAASSCCGAKGGWRQSAKVALTFSAVGVFCLLAGYFGGGKLLSYISRWDHIIGPALLFFLGAKMLWGVFKGDEEAKKDSFDMSGFKTLILLAVATNIDVLAAGVSLAAFELNIATVGAFLVFFVSLAVFSGFSAGAKFGQKFGPKAAFAGAVVLMLLSVKIFLEG